MRQSVPVVTSESAPVPLRRFRKRFWVPIGILLSIAIIALVAWTQRESLAGNFIARELERYGIEGRYTVERIGGRRQVLRDVSLGDPDRPDFTAAQVEVHLRYRLGTPQVQRIVLVRPRLFGRWDGERMSFGTLDGLLYQDSGGEFALPEIDIALRDGRAQLVTPFGPVGLKLDGEGVLADGFAGTIALAMPRLAQDDCRMERGSLFGEIAVADGAPRFRGPLRFGGIDCANIAMADGNLLIDGSADALFSTFQGKASLRGGAVGTPWGQAAGIGGTLAGRYRGGALTLDHDLALNGARTPWAGARTLALTGGLRTSGGGGWLWNGRADGRGLSLGSEVRDGIGALARTGEGTLVEPLARQFSAALVRAVSGGRLRAQATVRSGEEALTILMPEASVQTAGGQRIAALSQASLRVPAGGVPAWSGNIATSGAGLPSLRGRMERRGRETVFRLAMPTYRAGTSSLALPTLEVRQRDNGALVFDGRAVASGVLPNGFVEGAAVPLRGSYGPGGRLALWPGCTDLQFQSLRYAALRLGRETVRVCPDGADSIVTGSAAGVRVAGTTQGLDLAGSLGSSPIRLQAARFAAASPGGLAASDVVVTLGRDASANRFVIGQLDGSLSSLSGRFDETEVYLAAVPMDVREASGAWRYAEGALILSDADLRVTDRQQPARFEPLIARGARLTLVDNQIEALADLREPDTDRQVAGVVIRHDLATSRGYADLATNDLQFDEALQPSDLSVLAQGVVANVRGSVDFTGQVRWDGNGVTSGGTLATEALDLAAAFGPVRGLSGRVEFSDLLSLTTRGEQTLRLASVNPGIEVEDGEFTFTLSDWQRLSVRGGSWPFMGGRLVLRETDLNFGVEEARAYTFELIGAQAGVFVERMEIANLSATGTFDGVVPILFDERGNGRIEGGALRSRPSGGNVSYVGELTYKDLSPIANFAFDALRSLDYDTMTIGMDGPLTGEIVTRVRFDGVRQGAGAKTNFITRRLAKLPITFRINIRAQFYQLLTSMKSLYDPASVRDPRELGLLDDDGRRLRREITGDEATPDIDPEDLIPDTPIQQQESENLP